MRMMEDKALDFIHKRKRLTTDGKKCASSFSANGQTFSDCTDSKAPDGTISKKEWCELDQDEISPRRWGYCIPEMNYDKIRERVRDIKKDLIFEYNKIKDII